MNINLKSECARRSRIFLIVLFCLAVVPMRPSTQAAQAKKRTPTRTAQPRAADNPFAFRQPVTLAAFNHDLATREDLAVVVYGQKRMLVFDETNFYWVCPLAKRWVVMRVSKTGGEPVAVVSTDAEISAIAVDDENLYLSLIAAQGIVKMSKMGGELVSIAKLTSPCDVIFVDQANFYYVDGVFNAAHEFVETRLMKIAKDGSAPVKLATFNTRSILPLAGDRERLYWINHSEETINWMDKKGGSVKSIPASEPGYLVVDEQFIYWTGASGIMKMEKSSGQTTTLWTQGSGLGDDLAVDDDYIYFPVTRDDEARTRDYFKMKKVGGNLIPITVGSGISDFIIDKANFYWLDVHKKALLKVGKADPPDADPNVLRKALIVVSIPVDQEIYLDMEKVTPADLTKKIAGLAKLKSPADRFVILNIGKAVRYATVVSAMQAIEEAGIQRLKILTERQDLMPLLGMFEVRLPDFELMPPPLEIDTIASAKRVKPSRTKPAKLPPADLLILDLKSGNGENQQVELNTKPFTLSELQSALKEILEQRPEKMVFLKAPKSKPFSDVLQAIRVLNAAGADPIGLQLVYLED